MAEPCSRAEYTAATAQSGDHRSEITHNDTESLRWHQSSFKLKLVQSSLHLGGDLKFRLGKLHGAKGRRVPQNPDQQAPVGVRCLFKIQQP